MEQTKIPFFNEKFDLYILLKTLRKSIIWIIFIFILTIVSSFLYLRYTPLKFTSSSIVQINDKNRTNDILNIESIYKHSEIAPVIELIRSSEFLKRCYSLLPLDISYYKQGTFLYTEMYRSSPYNINVKMRIPSLMMYL